MSAPPGQRLGALTERLCREFPHLGAAQVQAVVDEALAAYATATVLAYLPLLVERDVRRALERR